MIIWAPQIASTVTSLHSHPTLWNNNRWVGVSPKGWKHFPQAWKHFPKSWNHAVVTSIHKKKTIKQPKQLPPNISTAHSIQNLRASYLVPLEYQSQSGFLPQHSCTTTVYKLYSDWLKTDRKRHLVLIFINFSKAFDAVSQYILMKKLESIGIADSALKLWQNVLTQRSKQVQVSGKLFTSQASDLGEPQGSIFCPNFVFYILTCTRFLDYHAYADDTIFYTSGPANPARYKYHQPMVLITRNENTDKSHCVITKANNAQINLTIDNTLFAPTNKTTLLEFTINQSER